MDDCLRLTESKLKVKTSEAKLHGTGSRMVPVHCYICSIQYNCKFVLPICGYLTDIIGHATTNVIDGSADNEIGHSRAYKQQLVILTNVYWLHPIILIIHCNILVELTNVDLLFV